jgi:hypothetical protein
MAEGDLGKAAGPSLTAFCGSYGLARLGPTSPTDTPRSRPVIGDFSNGFGVMTRIMTALAHELSIRGAIDVSEAFIDASFAPAKKGGAQGRKNEMRQGNKDHGGCKS